MTQQQIPEAAVEAAAKAIHDLGVEGPWDGRSEEIRDLYREDARAALGSAARYLMAQAWDEGCSEGLLVNNGWEAGALDANPYRSQA